jgi:hypothetical protein
VKKLTWLALILVSIHVLSIEAQNGLQEGAHIVVNSFTMDVADDGVCTLIEAIISANTNTPSGATPGECVAGSGADTIVLESGGEYVLTAINNETENGANGLPLITSDIMIRGGRGENSTIRREQDEGTPEFRIFEVSNQGVLRMEHVNISGGLVLDSETTPESCPTIECRYPGAGAAIFNDGGIVTLERSTISNNTARWGGAAIVNIEGDIVIENSTIDDNTTEGSGGGVMMFRGTVAINNSAISDNTALVGAGIYNFEGSLGVARSRISRNFAEMHTSGIMNYNGTATLFNSIISENNANRGAGGIENMEGGRVTILRSTITNNVGSDGLINQAQGFMTLQDSTVSDNQGGGIYNTGILELVNTVVNNNTREGSGGGIRNLTNVTPSLVLIRNSTISGNKSINAPGGGISNSQGTVVINDSHITENYAVGHSGGGIHTSGGTLVSLNSTFTDNVADRDGGGIYNLDTALFFDDSSVIRDNTAHREGGDIYP